MMGADAVRLVEDRFGLSSPPEGPLIPRERLVELARALYDELGYVYLSYITAVHYPAVSPAPPRAEKVAKHGAPPAPNSGDAPAAAASATSTQPLATPTEPIAMPTEPAALTTAPAAQTTAPAAMPTAPAVPELAPARYIIVYRVRNIARGSEFPFRCEVPVGTSVPSLARVWAGADWQEREAYDLVGPVFEGHPDLRRIMLPEDWDGHPLQRQYAIDTPHRPWR